MLPLRPILTQVFGKLRPGLGRVLDQLAGESRVGSVVWEDTFLHRGSSAKTLAVLAERAAVSENNRKHENPESWRVETRTLYNHTQEKVCWLLAADYTWGQRKWRCFTSNDNKLYTELLKSKLI